MQLKTLIKRIMEPAKYKEVHFQVWKAVSESAGMLPT